MLTALGNEKNMKKKKHAQLLCACNLVQVVTANCWGAGLNCKLATETRNAEVKCFACREQMRMTHIGSRTDLSTHLQWQFNFLRPQFPLCGDNAYTGHVVDSHKLRVASMIPKHTFIRSLNLFNVELSHERYWLGPRSQEVGGGETIPSSITLSGPVWFSVTAGSFESHFNILTLQ